MSECEDLGGNEGNVSMRRKSLVMTSFDDDWDPFDRLVYRENAHTSIYPEIQGELKYGGFVYVASNKFLPGLLKIGAAEQAVDDRTYSLYNTSVPGPFVCDYAILVERVFVFERQVHDALDFCRLNPDREFFEIGNLEAVRYIRRAYLSNMVPEYNERFQHGLLASKTFMPFRNSTKIS